MSSLPHIPSPRLNPPRPSFDTEHGDAPQAANCNPTQQPAIDMETFHQILDLDEDDTHEFSRGMAWEYFSQAAETFKQMEDAFAIKDLAKLSHLGHFLKGSSAALGVTKVQVSCELIQHYGKQWDTETNQELAPEMALAKIGPLLARVKEEYNVAEKWLKEWYGDYESKD